MFLLCAILLFKSLGDGIIGMNSLVGNSCYRIQSLLIFCFAITGLIWCVKVKHKPVFRKQMYANVLLVLLLGTLSGGYIIISGRFTTTTLSELYYLFIPCFIAYVLLNTLTFDDVFKAMKIVLVFSIIGYVLELGIGVFTLANLRLISFVNSFSPFESSAASGIATSLCAFFSFYRKEKKWTIISLLYSIMTFKRIAVVFSLIMFIMPYFWDVTRIVKKKWTKLLALLFIIATMSYYYLLQPDNIRILSDFLSKYFDLDVRTFTMGRSYMFETFFNSNYISYGLGSIADYIGAASAYTGLGIEMDLIRILCETSIVGLVGLVVYMWKLPGRQIYGVVYMFSIMLNLLTSHSLTSYHGWIIKYLVIGSVLCSEYWEVDVRKHVPQNIRKRLLHRGNKKF